MSRAFFFLLIFTPLAALAQSPGEISFQRTFLLRNATGTSANPGTTPHHPHIISGDVWTSFVEGAAFVSYSSETGPVVQRNEVFSTNWFAAGAQRSLGRRGLVLFRGRVSLEPFTVKEEGYPQLLQYVSAESGGPLTDAMRAHDLLGEAAVHAAYRLGDATFVHAYLAPVGDAPLGPVPFAQRASAEEFPEAPFAYDVQESFQSATRVATVGVANRAVSLEGGVFHHAVTTGRHSSVNDGGIDSWGGRLTVTPVEGLSFQLSRGKLGKDADETTVSSGSVSYGTESVASSAIWTRREGDFSEPLSSFGFELTVRRGRNTFMARAESADRPAAAGVIAEPKRSHLTIGYLFDILRGSYRAGLGASVDYHTKTHELQDTPAYGHKPQTIYLFVRLRTEATRR
jgi:hypothetical protein